MNRHAPSYPAKSTPPVYNAALYLRLSRDDDNTGESNSIATQRMILRQYAERNGLSVVDEYVDDGYSGTNFDRPDFKRMISDIEDGRINCVLVKDLSRFGRNYLETGMYIEMRFPRLGVRFIAVDSGIDSNIQQSAEFAPFVNIMNEWYARDISRKVTKAFRTRHENGAHYGAYAPLGYRKDPDQTGHLLIDDETCWIIKKIFAMAAQGFGAAKITHTLTAEQIPTASWLNFQRYGTFAHIYEGQPESKRYEWSIAQVKSILQDETYIGNSIHNKQTNVSYKDKKKIRKPKSEWWRAENTHEAIISKDVFELVQQSIANRRRRQKNGTTQIFAGLVKCSDCGWSLAFATNNQNKNPYGYYHCSKHGQGLRQCSMHYIRYDVLYAAVLSRLQYWIQNVHQDEETVRNHLLQASEGNRTSTASRAEQEKKRCEKRLAKLDDMFAKLYEDQLSGKISERNFKMLSAKYQNEQSEMESKIETLTTQLKSAKQQSDGIDKWIALAKKISNPTELSAELLNTLIEKIIVHEATKDADGNREQEIEILYRFIGKID